MVHARPRSADTPPSIRRRGLGVLAAAVLVLTACSDDSGSDLPEADATASASATPEWEWSATEAPPEPAAQELSSDSAQEYLQFVLTTIFYSYATGDADPVAQQADEGLCEGCRSLQRFADLPERKLQVAGAEPTFTVTDERVEDETFYNYSVSMDIPAGERIDTGDPDNVEQTSASSDVPATVNIRWVEDSWTLLNFSLGE